MSQKPQITLQFPVVPSLTSLLKMLSVCADNPEGDRDNDHLLLQLTDEGQAALAALLAEQNPEPSRISVNLFAFLLDVSCTDCSYRYQAAVHRGRATIGAIEITAFADRSGRGVLTLYP